MYQLQQVNPSHWEQCPTLTQFYDDLAKKPYCTNEKGNCYPRTKAQAIRHAYIQPNHPQLIKWLCFDVDDPNAIFAYHDNNAPKPQIIIRNPENGHAHYCYRLTTPVAMWGNAHVKPIEYLRAVYNALNRVLGGDTAFGGNLIKNPTSQEHQTYLTGAKPSYSLDELARNLDLDEPETTPASNQDCFGRNLSVFNHVRHLAYPIAHLYPENVLKRKLDHLASVYNDTFDTPLLPNELHHITKSITRFCKSARFGAYSEQSKARFSELQAKRGAKGGKVSKRPKDPNSDRTQKPWEQMGISRKTYYKRKQKSAIGGDQISHNQIIAPKGCV